MSAFSKNMCCQLLVIGARANAIFYEHIFYKKNHSLLSSKMKLVSNPLSDSNSGLNDSIQR